MPDDIAACQVAEADIIQTGQHLHSNVQTGLCSRRKVFLRSVAGDDNLEPKPIRVRNIFIWAGVVFCASSRMI